MNVSKYEYNRGYVAALKDVFTILMGGDEKKADETAASVSAGHSELLVQLERAVYEFIDKIHEN